MINPFAVAPEAWVSPSLNRLRIVDIPGLSLQADVKGRQVYDLLSTPALEGLIRRRTAALGLDPDTPDLLRALDACLVADSPDIRDTANEIAATFGRYLGLALLALKRADDVNKRARPAWREGHWRFWQEIDTVCLGGGLMAGRFGPLAAHSARKLLHDHGNPQYRVELSSFPRELALFGAARHASPTARNILLFDFGQTYVKRAAGHYQEGALKRIIFLPDRLSPCGGFPIGEATADDVQRHASGIARMIGDGWLESAMEPPVEIIAAIACHLYRGHPYPGEMGCYGVLQAITNDLQGYLAMRLSERLSQTVRLTLLQDATSAAAVYAGSKGTAVLMLGTAVGIGFPPTDVGLRPLALNQSS